MYYSSDRQSSIYLLLTAVFYLMMTLMMSYFAFNSINPEKCKITDIVNMTDGSTSDVAFLVLVNGIEDIAFGTDYYYVGNTYICYDLMGVYVLNNDRSYIDIALGLGITNLVFVCIMVFLTIIRTIYIYKVTREFSYLSQ